MFLTWQLTVGNRLESRPSFSNTLVWNNFPLPEIDKQQRCSIAEAGATVVEARTLFPELSLAQLYTPDGLPEELAAAHEALDNAVDTIFGLDCRERTFEGRQRALFEAYARLENV